MDRHRTSLASYDQWENSNVFSSKNPRYDKSLKREVNPGYDKSLKRQVNPRLVFKVSFVADFKKPIVRLGDDEQNLKIKSWDSKVKIVVNRAETLDTPDHFFQEAPQAKNFLAMYYRFIDFPFKRLTRDNELQKKD